MQELARRCDTLIRLVEKENEENEAAEREERKKSTGRKPGWHPYLHFLSLSGQHWGGPSASLCSLMKQLQV